MLKANNEKIELWKNRIEDCKSSGLTIRFWCKENKVSASQYHYGIIEYDVKNETFLSIKQTSYENEKKFYVRNVKNKLVEFAKGIDKIPKEYNLVIC